jgi:hypothetical protein
MEPGVVFNELAECSWDVLFAIECFPTPQRGHPSSGYPSSVLKARRRRACLSAAR